jgi:hypothetical protein
MNGFFVTISNDLLEDKHFEKMGNAVWLYMWLIDKMTEISEGIGIVSYGNPISLIDVRENFPTLNERTYQRMIKTLKDGGYINTAKAKYGLYITVNKPKKIFGGKTRPDKSVVSQNKTIKTRQKRRQDPTNLSPSPDKNVGSLYIDNNTNTIQTTNNSTEVELGDTKSPDQKEQIKKLYYECIKTYKLPVMNHNTLRAKINAMVREDEPETIIKYLIFMRDQYQRVEMSYKPRIANALDFYTKRVQIREAIQDEVKSQSTSRAWKPRGRAKK